MIQNDSLLVRINLAVSELQKIHVEIYLPVIQADAQQTLIRKIIHKTQNQIKDELFLFKLIK